VLGIVCLELPYASFIPACRCGVERGSVALAWFRVTIIIVLVLSTAYRRMGHAGCLHPQRGRLHHAAPARRDQTTHPGGLGRMHQHSGRLRPHAATTRTPRRGGPQLIGRVRPGGGAMSQARGALRAQTRGIRQVLVHRLARSIHVHRIHDPGLAGLPPAPTHLLVDNEDGCSDNPG
jgi:hypothetical protein